MSGEGGFLTRWSKRKRGERDEDVASAPSPLAPAQGESSPGGGESLPVELNLPEVPDVGEPQFDLASLPTLDELTGSSDMSAFLQKGVPQGLQNAALRKAWALDPFIRDHIGPVECGWDFNDPNSMAGFGPLDANVDTGAMLKQIMGEPDSEKSELDSGEELPEKAVPDEMVAPQPVATGEADEAESPAQEGVMPDTVLIAPQTALATSESHAALHNDGIDKIEEIPVFPGRRRHGGAVPG